MSLLTICLVLFTSLQGNTSSTKAIAEIEQRFTTAIIKKDDVAVDALLADDLLHVGFEGQIAGKAEYMAFFKQGAWQYKKYEPSNVTIKALGNVAVVTGRVDRTIVVNNVETVGAFAFTHVWSRTGDRWRLTSSTVTTIVKAS